MRIMGEYSKHRMKNLWEYERARRRTLVRPQAEKKTLNRAEAVLVKGMIAEGIEDEGIAELFKVKPYVIALVRTGVTWGNL